MADAADRAQAVEAMDLALALDKRKRPTNPVLSNGQCDECEDPIEPKRLANNPHVERCIDCQRIYELKLKRRIGR